MVWWDPEFESRLRKGDFMEADDADSKQIYERLKDFIRTSGLGVGDRLPPERALAEQLGVARNTIRKSMSQLVAEGTISRHVGRGTFVAAMAALDQAKAKDPDFTLLELLEVRLAIEPPLMELVVERATDRELADFSLPLEAMSGAATWVDFKEAKYGLHLAFARATRNGFFEHILMQIIAQRRKSGWQQANGPRSLVGQMQRATLEEYGQLVGLLQARDGTGARNQLQASLMRTIMVLGAA